MAAINLPRQVTPFVGREQEITEIVTLLDTPACQLLTLVGPGGGGKTRLALEVATRKLVDFTNHVFFVSLQSLSAVDDIPNVIADALDLPRNAETDPQAQLYAYFERRRLLLVLDNCEHLLEGVDFIAEIVQRAPKVKILATSREPLKLQQEWLLRVGGMSHSDAVPFFVDRARQVQVDFDLDRQRSGVLRICHLVEGMPLALELAASWVRSLACKEIGDEIERNLDFLTSALRDRVERHRSIQAVFEHSWRLLSEAEQQVLPRLSVFQGGFEREAAEKIARADLRTLIGLVDKSLLRKDRLSGRYDLHELVKQYSAEKLVEVGEVEATSDAHVTYYAAFVLERENDLKSHRQLAALDETEADLENIWAAWMWALNRNQFVCLSNMLEGLHLYSLNRDSYRMELFFKAARARLSWRSGEPSELLYGRLLARSDVEDPQARSQLDAGLKIVEQRGERFEIGLCLFYKGWIALHLDTSPLEAAHILEQALAHFESLSERYYMARTRCELSLAYTHQGRHAEAVEYAKHAAALARTTGDRFCLLWSLVAQDKQAQLTGDYPAVQRFQQEIISLSQQVNYPELICCMRLVQTFYGDFVSGDFERARNQIDRVLSETSVMEDSFLIAAWSSVIMGMLANVEGDYGAARELCKKGELHRVSLDAVMACGLGIAAFGLGEYDEVVPITLPVMEKAQTIDGLGWMAWCLPPFVLLLAHEGQPEQAVELLGLAFAHPASLSGWLDKWPLLTQLRTDLEAKLGSETYMSVWERGANGDLSATAANLLEHYNPQTRSSQPLSAPLKAREREILRLVAEGLSDRAIAQELTLAVGTINWYMNEIRSKLGVNNRVAAIKRARELHVI